MRPFWLSVALAVSSFACIVALRIYLEKDTGLRVYYSTPFTQWGALAEQVRGIPNVTCPPQHETHQALGALLEAAWCADRPIPEGFAPRNRSAVCRCVADAWLGLVQGTCGNQTGGVRVTTAEARSTSAERVVGCLDRTPRYRITAGATDLSLVFPTSVCMYCNCSLLLITMGCIVFFGLNLGEPVHFRVCGLDSTVVYGQLLLFGLFGGMCALFLTTHIEGTWLNTLALLIVYINLAFGLQEEHARRVKSGGEELDMCVFATLPQILPGYLLLASVAGYGRDLGAYGTAMALGALLGLGLEWCWLCCDGRRDDPPPTESEQRLLREGGSEIWHGLSDGVMGVTALLCVLILYTLYAGIAGLTLQDLDSPLLASAAWPLTVLIVLLLLCGVCALDVAGGGGKGCGLAAIVVGLANLVMTGLTCRDAGL